MRRTAMAGLAVVVAALAAGCTSRSSSPRTTLQALVAATRSRDPSVAIYEMLPSSARRAESLERFRSRVLADRRSLEELSAALEEALAADMPVTAELVDGTRRALAVEERSGWRLGGPALGDATVVTTPGRDGARAALEHLRRALVRGDLAGLLGMLTARARGTMERDLRELGDALADPDALHFPEVPGATRVRLPDGRVLSLVWERDGWHVDGLREGATP